MTTLFGQKSAVDCLTSGVLGKGALAIVMIAGLAACATPPSQDDPIAVAEYEAANDPIEPVNRAIFAFNLEIDKAFLKPAAQGYRAIVPEPGRDAVRNFVNNIQEPVTFINDMLQLEFDRAGSTFGRFIVNSTIGIGGVFNVAGIEAHNEDFGQTMAVYGVPSGPYLVLPFINSATPRHGVGRIVDSYSNPIFYAFDKAGQEWVQPAVAAADIIDSRSRNIESLDEIERTAIDFYATARSAYQQSREQEINNGKASEQDQQMVDPFDVDY